MTKPAKDKCLDIFKASIEKILFAHEVAPEIRARFNEDLINLCIKAITDTLKIADSLGATTDADHRTIMRFMLGNAYRNAVCYLEESHKLATASPQFQNHAEFVEELGDYMRNGLWYCNARKAGDVIDETNVLKAVRERDLADFALKYVLGPDYNPFPDFRF